MFSKIGLFALVVAAIVLSGCINAHWDPRRGPSVNLGFPVHGGYGQPRPYGHHGYGYGGYPVAYGQPVLVPVNARPVYAPQRQCVTRGNGGYYPWPVVTPC